MSKVNLIEQEISFIADVVIVPSFVLGLFSIEASVSIASSRKTGRKTKVTNMHSRNCQNKSRCICLQISMFFNYYEDSISLRELSYLTHVDISSLDFM